MRSPIHLSVLLVAGLFCLTAQALPKPDQNGLTLFVDAQAKGTGQGTSWENAFTNLQTALAIAEPNDRILVAQGRYVPTSDPNDRKASFILPAGVTVSGGYQGVTSNQPQRNDPLRYPSILSGDINNTPNNRFDNSRVVVTYHGRSNKTTLQGFTIANASSLLQRGTGLECIGPGELQVINCIFKNNQSNMGGGCYVGPKAKVQFQRCLWQNNSAIVSGGAIAINNKESKLTHCIFLNNTAGEYGGAVTFNQLGSHHLINCLFNANSAGTQGGAIWATGKQDETAEKTLTILNCTFAHNSAVSYVQVTGNGLLMNSLFDTTNPTGPNVTWNHSLVAQSLRWFIDPNGPDGQAGTLDDDLRLSANATAVDAGLIKFKRLLPAHDLDSSPRIINDKIDVGAYEYWDAIFVDDDAPGDPEPYNPYNSDPFENGAINHPFDSLKEALKAAQTLTLPSAPPSFNRRHIVVAPGLYAPQTDQDDLNFAGYNLRITSRQPHDITTIERTVLGYTIVFKGTEDARCELAGFTIQHPNFDGIYGNNTQASIRNCRIVNNRTCDGSVLSRFAGTLKQCLIAGNRSNGHCGQRPVLYEMMGSIENCTITDNHLGIHLSTGCIENSIIWGNDGTQLMINGDQPVEIRYSNIGDGISGIFSWAQGETTKANLIWGPGNMNKDPLFVRHGQWQKRGPAEAFILGDYHLQSQGWRYVKIPNDRISWTFDLKTSPCIDTGDPTADWSNEPMSVPMDSDNDFGFNKGLNLGVYGNTPQASFSPTKQEHKEEPITKESRIKQDELITDNQ